MLRKPRAAYTLLAAAAPVAHAHEKRSVCVVYRVQASPRPRSSSTSMVTGKLSRALKRLSSKLKLEKKGDR